MASAAITFTHFGDLIPLVTNTLECAVTRHDYERELRSFLEWYAASQQDGFDRRAVQAYKASMIDAERGPVSINKALSAIRKLASEGAACGYLNSGVAKSIVDVPNLKRLGEPTGNWIGLEKLREILSAPPPTTLYRGLRDRAALHILATCGLRREEAAGLRFGQLCQRGGRWVLADVTGKGGRVRTAPVITACYAAITAWTAAAGIDQADMLLLPTVRNPDRVTTMPASGARLYDAVIRYCEAIPGLDIRPHDLRRTFAVLCIEGGATLVEVRDALGHANISTTDIYLRGPMALKSAAADRIII